MTLQKKQLYLNKVLSKHYKKLKYTLFNKTKNIPALKTTAIMNTQAINISVLTIDTIRHKDFPNIVDVSFLNGFKKTKKAALIFQGKTKISTTFTRSINKLAQRPSEEEARKSEEVKHALSLVFTPRGKFAIIDKMLGAGIHMYNYKLCFNSHLSLQYFNFLQCRQGVKLKSLDRFAASLISLYTPDKSKDLQVKNQEVLKEKTVRLSKTELSSLITQVLYKTHFLKGQESLGESVFNIKKLSNILGAIVEINSKIYYISDTELKQCGLVEGLKHLTLHSDNSNTTRSLLKDLLNSKMTKDKRILLNTKSIEPNIVFFNVLNIAARTYVMHNIKKIFSKLIHILSIFVLSNPLSPPSEVPKAKN